MIICTIDGHDMLPFIDGFSSYNQILINPADQYKITFTNPLGNFCYKVMPFRLKNAKATCQRIMVTIFYQNIHKIMEVYVDDILVKFKQGQDHLQAHEEVFNILQRYK